VYFFGELGKKKAHRLKKIGARSYVGVFELIVFKKKRNDGGDKLFSPKK
jgi:hypothetical protein